VPEVAFCTAPASVRHRYFLRGWMRKGVPTSIQTHLTLPPNPHPLVPGEKTPRTGSRGIIPKKLPGLQIKLTQIG